MSAEVIDARTLVPFNYDTVIESVKKTGRIVIVTRRLRARLLRLNDGRPSDHRDWPSTSWMRPPVVVASQATGSRPAHELEEAFFPQPSWILDAIDAKIVPLKGHVRTTNQTLGNKLKNERKGV